MRVLPVYVFSNQSFEGCSNNGISEKYDQLYLIHEEGFITIEESNIPENVVKLVRREILGKEYLHLEPYWNKSKTSYMAGGSYAFSSDSRFTKISKYPLSIHDRQE